MLRDDARPFSRVCARALRPETLRTWRLRQSHRANPALAKKRWARVAPARPALARPAVRTLRCDAPLHLRGAARLAAAPGSVEAGPLAQSRPHTGPRAASPDLPRRGSGSADARGAFHRRAALARRFASFRRRCRVRAFARDAGLSPYVGLRQGTLPRLSPTCGECAAPFNLRPGRTAFDEPPAAKARSPDDWSGPKPVDQPNRGRGVTLFRGGRAGQSPE